MSQVKDFRPATVNANKHTARGLGAIDKSIRTDGYGDPMLAAADGEMISGSARLETVAQVFGTEVEPIIVHSDGTRPVIHVRDDIPNASDKRAVRLALAANRSHELDLAWDVEVLAGLDADVLVGLWSPYELSQLGEQWAHQQGDDPNAEWVGMPEFQQEDKTSFRSIHVHFANQEDVDKFSELVCQDLGEGIRSIWYPKAEKTNMLDVYANES
jgi:hypothetical protein